MSQLIFKHKNASNAYTCNIQASLLLSCVVALITTTPPEEALIDYSQRGPYICLWIALGILLGGVVVGSADIYVLSTCCQGWCQRVCFSQSSRNHHSQGSAHGTQTMMATRARLMSTLIFLAYPFIAIGCATLVCVFGGSRIPASVKTILIHSLHCILIRATYRLLAIFRPCFSDWWYYPLAGTCVLGSAFRSHSSRGIVRAFTTAGCGECVDAVCAFKPII